MGVESPQELLLCLVLSSHTEGFLRAQNPRLSPALVYV